MLLLRMVSRPGCTPCHAPRTGPCLLAPHYGSHPAPSHGTTWMPLARDHVDAPDSRATASMSIDKLYIRASPTHIPLVHGFYLYMASVHGFCTWFLVHGFLYMASTCTWLLYMASVHGFLYMASCTWLLYMASVHGFCTWLLVHGFYLYMASVHGFYDSIHVPPV